VRSLASAFLDLLLPWHCLACGRPTDAVPLCAGCDLRAPAPWPDLPAPKPLRAWHATVAHDGAARDWIRRASGEAGPLPDAVVPVALHPRRLRERGFNPAGRLAKLAARSLGVPVRPVLLERLRDTPSQTGLGRRARLRNVRGAFQCAGSAPQRIWLVDDVATTGATLAEAARALRRAGGRDITGLCLAWRPPFAD
jgi:predicted amidophosphoribosyltransferase